MPCCSENKVKVFEVKVIVCLYLTKSGNSFSNPFQRPFQGHFDRVSIHTEFEGLFSNIFIKNYRSKKSLCSNSIANSKKESRMNWFVYGGVHKSHFMTLSSGLKVRTTGTRYLKYEKWLLRGTGIPEQPDRNLELWDSAFLSTPVRNAHE